MTRAQFSVHCFNCDCDEMSTHAIGTICQVPFMVPIRDLSEIERYALMEYGETEFVGDEDRLWEWLAQMQLCREGRSDEDLIDDVDGPVWGSNLPAFGCSECIEQVVSARRIGQMKLRRDILAGQFIEDSVSIREVNGSRYYLKAWDAILGDIDLCVRYMVPDLKDVRDRVTGVSE